MKSIIFSSVSLNPAVCPIDKEPIDDDEIFQDKHLMREIGQLKCYCNNNNLGCSWKGDLLELQVNFLVVFILMASFTKCLSSCFILFTGYLLIYQL